MSPNFASCTAMILFALYALFLVYVSRKDRQFKTVIIISASIVFILGWALDGFILYRQMSENFFTALSLGAIHSMEAFLFRTHLFDNRYSEFFNSDNSQLYLSVFTFLYLAASAISVTLIIRGVVRFTENKHWLSRWRETDNVHIFFGMSKAAMTLAEDIHNTRPGEIIITVLDPDVDIDLLDMSLWDRIRRVFGSDDSLPQRADSTTFKRVMARKAIKNVTGPNFLDEMGLQNLHKFLNNPKNKVYILSDSEEDNIYCADIIVRCGCKADIYCRASRNESNRLFMDAMRNVADVSFNLVDSAFLAVRGFKESGIHLPVSFVNIHKDKEGRSEGWVESPFTAMILGFGETGQEVLPFLYEYGSFCGRDGSRAGFSCTVIDSRISDIIGSQKIKHPGLIGKAGIKFMECKVGSPQFWDEVRSKLNSLNYVVVCMGNDTLNLRLATEIMEFAYKEGKDLSKNFVIHVLQEANTDIGRNVVDLYNSIEEFKSANKEATILNRFGMYENVWTYNNVTDSNIKNQAFSYYKAYNEATKIDDKKFDPEKEWNDREEAIRHVKSIKSRERYLRERYQDFENCLYRNTMEILLGDDVCSRAKEVSDAIPVIYDDQTGHYTIDDPYTELVLRNASATEHLRWMASLEGLGYTYGETKDDLLKTHHFMKEFPELKECTRHNDYLVVKTTLLLHAGQE
ncbi:MAG: hypothetical protein IJ151_07280 [Bacteroidales bacterium]|nr:hypothetical protein [Bacteroidales bacterium]